MPKKIGAKHATQVGPANSGTAAQIMSQQSKAKRQRKWLGYVATIVQHLCDQGIGHKVAVSMAEAYSYTKAKQFAQRIKRGEA